MKKVILLLALSVLLYSAPGHTGKKREREEPAEEAAPAKAPEPELAWAAPEAWAASERANAPPAEILERAETMEKKLRKEGYETRWKVVQVMASVKIDGFNPKSGEKSEYIFYIKSESKLLRRILEQEESAFEFDFLPLALKRVKTQERKLKKAGYETKWSVKDSCKELALIRYNSTSGKHDQNMMLMHVEDPDEALQMIQAGRRVAPRAGTPDQAE